MATARKTTSGKWRVLVFDYTDDDGKRHYRSFTADTKKQAELKAALFLNENKNKASGDITVSDAIERYINAKEGVLSPSTIRGYKQMQNNYYESIGKISVNRLTTEKLQAFVSTLAGKVSAKSVANIYGLLISSITMFCPNAAFRVSLPKRVKKKTESPSDDVVATLFSAATGDLRISIALAAFGSLRRGEICALKHSDISGNIVSIHADMVENSDNKFVYKDIPKTSDSVRKVSLPAEVIALLPKGEPDDFIVSCSPDYITQSFIKLRNRFGLNIRFHDLRHYYASVGAVLGVPDTYLSDFGGWRRGSGVMKDIYQNVIVSESEKFANKMVEHFQEVISTSSKT